MLHAHIFDIFFSKIKSKYAEETLFKNCNMQFINLKCPVFDVPLPSISGSSLFGAVLMQQPARSEAFLLVAANARCSFRLTDCDQSALRRDRTGNAPNFQSPMNYTGLQETIITLTGKYLKKSMTKLGLIKGIL